MVRAPTPQTAVRTTTVKPSNRISRAATAAAVTLLLAGPLAGCAIGPDFERPALPTASGYTRTPLPASTAAADVAGGKAQRFVMGDAITAQWWKLFGSPQLNALIEQAIANNPSLDAAEASLRQAEELLDARKSILFPSIDANLDVRRAKSYANFGGGQAVSIPAYTIATGSVQVSYVFDLFGGSFRALESTRAQTEAVKFQMEAAYLTLTSNVIIAAVQQASLRAQVEATQTILGAQEQQLDLLRRQLELGGVAEADVLTQQTAVAQTRAQLPQLQKQLSQVENQILALAGRFPSQEPGVLFDFAEMQLPEVLPVTLPSQLVEQRPDVRASQAYLQSASAEIGVATALMLPQVSLNANYGSSASSLGDLFSAGSGIWSLSAGIVQPIFRGGQLRHQRKAAIAAYDAAAANYRGTVIGAFQNVSDVLRALEVDAEAVKAQLEAERAAAESLEIAQNRFQSGATDFLTLLDAQRTYQQTRIALVQAQASRYADTAALFVALGGGWWNRSQDTAANVAAAN